MIRSRSGRAVIDQGVATASVSGAGSRRLIISATEARARLTDPTTGGPLPTARPLFIRQNGGPRLIGTGSCP